MVSRLIEKAEKFETQSHYQSNIQEKLKPFLDVCNISKVASPSPDAEKTTPLSPKRPESPTGKQQNNQSD